MPRPTISSSAFDDDTTRQPSRRPRIHPALYCACLLSTLICGVFLVSELAGYAPPSAHLPTHHDELFYRPANPQNSALESGHSGVFRPRTWNSIANALGGFSVTSVYSPELNVSWTARPAGFGPRILGDRALEGDLHSIGQYSQDADPLEAVKGCRVDVSKAVTRKANGSSNVALVERGECPFITKIINAQALHFDAVIIYNDRGTFGQVDDDELLNMWSPSRDARLLSIPSVFVGRAAGKTMETLANAATAREGSFVVAIQPEEPPHLFLLDIVIMLFFLPTLFTTVVLIVTRVRQIRYRRAQRAPQELVDSLPSFVWREGLQQDIEALEVGEKDVSLPGSETQQGRGKRTRRPSVYLSDLLARATRRPGQTEGSAVPAGKAKHLARKIFSQTECAICLGDFVNGECVKLLPCGHLFHKVSSRTTAIFEKADSCCSDRDRLMAHRAEAMVSGLQMSHRWRSSRGGNRVQRWSDRSNTIYSPSRSTAYHTSSRHGQ